MVIYGSPDDEAMIKAYKNLTLHFPGSSGSDGLAVSAATYQL